jgi:copper transporter 1
MSVLNSICVKDTGMSSMIGCKSYVSLCREGTIVEECSQNPGVPGLVPTFLAIQETIDMCNQMNMDGCSSCASSRDCSDPLSSLSQVCLSMEMSGCQEWEQMCSAIESVGNENGFSKYCGGPSSASASDIPLMRMYFHTGIAEYVLFKTWIPQDGWDYFGTILFILTIGILSSYLKLVRSRIIDNFEPHIVISAPKKLSKLQVFYPQWNFPLMFSSFNFVRTFFSLLIVTIDYLLMLIAMTFNMGLFIAVMFAFALGTFLFSSPRTQCEGSKIQRQVDLEPACCMVE